jgi:uncharacterized protein YraI
MSKFYPSNELVKSFVPSPAHRRSSYSFLPTRCWCALLALLLLLLLTACGPESSGASNEKLVADAQQIALDYQTTGNLEQARTSLTALPVANANQWLIFVAESAIEQNADANTLAALVKLTSDLGLETGPITEYGIQHNLLVGAAESIAAVDPPVAEAQAAPPVQEAPPPTPIPTLESVVVITPTVAPTPTAAAIPMAKAIDLLNVRGGPGTDYNIVGGLQKDELVQIAAKSPAGDWWQVNLVDGQQGWVFGELVQVVGDTAAVAVAANIPAPPPTAVPAPVEVAAAPANPPEAAPAEAPAAEPETEATPAPDPNAAPYFTLASRRLWGKAENDGCVGKHLLRIHVIDASGVRLNGVRLKGIYTGIELVTGDQGKGDGIIEFDLHGSGEGFKVIRNNDGREANSDPAEGFTTRSVDIPVPMLIETGYCTNQEDCQIFYNSWGCQGHHSWEATFQRNY